MHCTIVLESSLVDFVKCDHIVLRDRFAGNTLDPLEATALSEIAGDVFIEVTNPTSQC